MQKRIVCCLVPALLVALAGTAMGANTYWNNGTGNNSWHDGGNWSLGAAPTAYEESRIDSTDGPVISGDAYSYNVWMGENAPAALTMTSGTLTDDWYSIFVSNMVVGWSYSSSFTMTGGRAYASIFVCGQGGYGDLYVGPDARLTTNHYQVGKGSGTAGGEADIYGILDVQSTLWGGVGNTVLHPGGIINVAGSLTNLPNVVAEEGYTLNFDSTSVSGWTIVTCVPEPMSALLMLCGLPLLRRRRSA